jgi:UDP-N-acetylmuramate: L-alanyl-gamma-D-glutamyl-meso-diaminopimelate ligase
MRFIYGERRFLFIKERRGPLMTIQSESTLPENVRSVHLIAICGTAMGALACMLKEMGYHITGSDQHVYPPMSEFLRSKGIYIYEGFHGDHLAARPDLVVVGNAVSKENPEAKAMQSMGLSFCSMPQAINWFAAAGKKQIVIAGTHGKTTTSAFIAWMLHCAQMDPSFLIGGILSDFNSNYRVGGGNWIVLEGDEYDTAYFDKGAKFFHYTPDVAIITSIEFDHADIFKDLDAIKQTFRKFMHSLPDRAALVAFDDDENIAELLPVVSVQIVGYGKHPATEWTLGEVRIAPPFTYFRVFRHGQPYGNYRTRMIGLHNLFNLLAGVAVAHKLNIESAVVAHALESFKGVRRRQEVRGIKNDIVVIDDFAHHPTAVRETIQAVKSFYGQRRLVAIFEPRTNSSRRDVFQSVYPTCFDGADEICIRQAPLLEKIPEGQRFSSSRLVAELCASGKKALFFEDTDAIIHHLHHKARPGDVLLIMSNGGFDNIHARLLDAL